MDYRTLNKPLSQTTGWMCLGTALLLGSLIIVSAAAALHRTVMLLESEEMQAAALQSLQARTKAAQPKLGESTIGKDSEFIVVKYKDENLPRGLSVASERASIESSEDLKQVREYEASGVVVYEVPESSTADEAAQRIFHSEKDLIEYAEVDAVTELAAYTANDPYFTSGSMWGTYGDASSPTNAFGSQAAEAWSTDHIGSSNVVVGVVDTGVNYTHQDLYLNIWLNQGEIPAAFKSALADIDGDALITFRDLNHTSNAAYVTDKNGNTYIDGGDLLNDSRWENSSDDDGNTYVDDLIGWDFAYLDNDPSDINGHGTHVAGTIGAVGGNGTGVVGVGWNTTLLPLKFTNDDGGGFVSRAAAAMDYMANQSRSAANKEYEFVATNNSWGTSAYSTTLQGGIERAAVANILTVAAAGNNQRNTDTTPYYPQGINTQAALGYESVISVGGSNNTGDRAWFSNYGKLTVDLLAPGQEITSTLPGQYGTLSGTSMSAPHVAGAVGVYAAAHPGATLTQTRNAILGAVQQRASVLDSSATGGLLDISKMFPTGAPPADTTPPTAPTNLRLATAAADTVTFEWDTATDNVGVTGYQVYRAGTNLGSVVQRFYTDTGLSPKTGYEYSVRAVDAAGNTSESSTVLRVATTIVPQEIISFAVASKTPNTATIAVDTLLPGSVRIHYGTNRADLNLVARSGDTNSRNHLVQLQGLTPGGLYYYRIVAMEQATSSNIARQRVSTFVTPTTEPFSITSHILSAQTATSAEIQVSLSSAGNVRINYGTTTRTMNQVAYVPARLAADGKQHLLQLTSLLPNTTYFYRVVAINLADRSDVQSTRPVSFITSPGSAAPIVSEQPRSDTPLPSDTPSSGGASGSTTNSTVAPSSPTNSAGADSANGYNVPNRSAN